MIYAHGQWLTIVNATYEVASGVEVVVDDGIGVCNRDDNDHVKPRAWVEAKRTRETQTRK